MAETDETLYRRFLAEHNEEDLRVLLERHREQLLLFLNGYVHNLEDAEELTLDAFAEAAAGSSVFREQSSFKTWLFSIGKNMALMRLRKRRFTSDESFERTAEIAAPPELNILREERNRQLYEALSQLKEEYRQILILLYFEEMSHEEVGRVMGKTKRQVYNLAERGRTALGEKLKRMRFDYAQYR
ncbi:MAG: sigma-70 family RNA polymerase sigma factor [Oscillospiraceae bacterium]|nr:sigma-70 family RNA polymerase sigma factor [Oscillospiraceae bacterium]